MSETRLLSNWEKFILISWKNTNVLWHHRWKTFLSLLMPSIFAVIMILVRIQLNVEFQALAEFQSNNLDEAWKSMIKNMVDRRNKFFKANKTLNCFVPEITLAFAPNSEFHVNFMNNAATKYLPFTQLAQFENEDELREAMLRKHYIAGIYFHEFPHAELNENNQSTQNLNYSIIFPSELRIVHDNIISKGWETNRQFDYHTLWQPETSDDGGRLGYIREGFASILNGISMSFMEFVLNEENLPDVRLKRFPISAYSFDPLFSRMNFGLPIILMIGYLYPCTILIEHIVDEKKIHVSDVLRVLGIGTAFEFLCWFMKGFTIIFISTIMVTTILNVRWVNGNGILGKSSWWALLFFLTSYSIASISFFYMISSATTKTNIAVIFLGVLWFLSYLPYLALKAQADQEFSKLTFVMMLIFSNTAMAIGVNIIVDLEEEGMGLQWKNFFDSSFHRHELSVGFIVVSQLILGVLYMLVGLYMSQIKSYISKLYLSSHFLLLLEHSPEHEPEPNERRRSYIRDTQIFEIESRQKKISIELKEVSKKVEGIQFIKNVSFCIYENEMTVIMGHNGSGKTLLLSLIAGTVTPSSGNIVYDETEGFKDIYGGISMGLCINNILFPDLTVSNQIMFFCRLKGLMGDALKEEVQKYLAAMDLTKVAEMLTRNLTDGQIQHLNVCCALCGNSKFVILDEPSTGMDLGSRKLLWDLLLNEKRNRTIVITTHSSEEADILADRLMIISGGELMCSGSIQFLKTVYGEGFRLTCVKDSHCDTENVTEFIRQYVPNIQPESDIGSELSYRLREYNTKIFSKLLADLEDSFFQLQLTSCSISGPTAEDIFMRMGSENPSKHDRIRLNEIMNGCSVYVQEYERLSFVRKYNIYTGMQMIISQWRAMITKQFFYHKNQKKIFFLQIGMPALVTFFTFLMRHSDYHREELPNLEFSLKMYRETAIIIDTLYNVDKTDNLGKEYNRFKNYYYNQASMMGTTHFYQETGKMTFREYIIEKQDKDKQFRTKYICGASYLGSEVIAWFNNYPLHVVPLSLTLVHNALLRSRNHTNTIIVRHAPLPYQTYLDPDAVITIVNFGNIFTSNLAVIISFVFTFCITFTIHERVVRFKLLQYMHGMRPFTFFASSLAFEYVKITTIAFLVVITMFCFGHSPQTLHFKVFYFQTIVMFGICIVPFYYLISHLFKDQITGYTSTTIFNLYGVEPWDQFAFHKQLISLLVLGILSTISLFLVEYRKVYRRRMPERIPRDNLKLAQEEYTRIHSDDSYENDGLINEKLSIHYLKSAYVNVPLIISHMGKIYGDRIAVNRISLMVERCECLAVLGVNGSGKSLIMKMLVGEVEMSFGRVFVNGISLTDDIFGMFKKIGYNPQISTMPINLTIHQILDFICRVRGIPKEHIADICECLCKVLGIFKYYDKVIARISPGIKRRLSSAIAMIGNPSLLLFDDVLLSVDPAGRRQIWNLISRLCKRGKAVFIATIYSAECDYFARRFAYIVNGKMQCIDTAQNLNKKYIRGYILIVKLRAKTRFGSTFAFLSTDSHIQMQRLSYPTPVFKLMSFVEQHFPNSIIKDQRGAIFYFLIPWKEITLSQIFRKMHRHSFSLNIEHFSITRDTLSMVFVDFAEIQREERQRTTTINV